MTWGFVAGAAISVVGGAISSKKSSKAADKASKRALAAGGAASELLEVGYEEAEERLSPYLASEKAANRQLMIEMGLTPDYSEQIGSSTTRLDQLRSELDAMGVTVDSMDGGRSFKDRVKDTQKDKFIASISPSGLFRSKKKKKKAKKRAKAEAAAREQRIESLGAQIEEEEARLSGFQQRQDQPLGEPGTAYMETPAYQATIEQGVSAVDQAAATGGSLYSGARGEALKEVGQNVQQSYYSNYMNILQNMATPTSTTNLSNIGIGTAGTIGQQNIAAQNLATGYNLQGVEAQNAAMADIVGGISSGVGAYMNRPQQPPQQQPTAIPATSSAWV